MVEPETASTTGAQHSANVRRRNVQNVEVTGRLSTPNSTGDDEKKVKAEVGLPPSASPVATML